MTPKFLPGESVILQSKTYPECNGEYTVLGVVLPGQVITCRLTGERCKIKNMGYRLAELATPDHDRTEIVWHESALRKKHEPAPVSFSELMASLGSPVDA